MTVRESGRDAVMINCNPETVSTDYDTCDRLYFEPLTLSDVLGVIELERPEGVIVQFGGQTPLKLAAGSGGRRRAAARHPGGLDRPGRGPPELRRAARRAGLKGPPYATARGSEEALTVADGVGYPLLVRPSYVLGGRAMEIVYSRDALADYLKRRPATAASARSSSTASSRTRSRSTSTRSATARDVRIGAIMQHVEEAGIHSGDSACVLPPHALGDEMLAQIREQTIGDRAAASAWSG